MARTDITSDNMERLGMEVRFVEGVLDPETVEVAKMVLLLKAAPTSSAA